jgi:hypothetical protein
VLNRQHPLNRIIPPKAIACFFDFIVILSLLIAGCLPEECSAIGGYFINANAANSRI